MGQGNGSHALKDALQSQRWGEQWSRPSPHCSISSLFNQQLSPGGKLRRDVPIRRYLLLYYQLSFSFSRLLYGKGLLITTEYFTLWESGSFCFCFCPHRMFLSAPCEGTGNYRAIHLNLHNFRQIL